MNAKNLTLRFGGRAEELVSPDKVHTSRQVEAELLDGVQALRDVHTSEDDVESIFTNFFLQLQFPTFHASFYRLDFVKGYPSEIIVATRLLEGLPVLCNHF